MHYFQTSVSYWAGEMLECSEPVAVYGPDVATLAEAEEWGRQKANTPSPWEGRDFDDLFMVYEFVREYEVDDGLEFPVDTEVRSYVYEGGRLVQTCEG